MTLTLLLDLDNTLISNDIDSFMPAYFKGLAQSLSKYADFDLILSLFSQENNQQLIQNNDPSKTLQDVFRSNFYPALGSSYQKLEPALSEFIENGYQKLNSLVSPRPEAVQMVDIAIERGYRIAIATNPLFPHPVTSARLLWGDFPPDKYQFEIVSTYEDFHFAKPNPAYFAEVLAQMGWPSNPVVMVGDDPEADILGARSLGLATYLITDEPGEHNTSLPLAGSGPISGLLSWIDRHSIEDLAPRFNSITAIDALLRSTPAALTIYLRSIPIDKWNHRPNKFTWSITEIVCHLRDIDLEINIPRVKLLLAENNAFIPGVDSDEWVDDRKYNQEDGQQALSEFISSRIKLLNILSELKDDDWKRTCRHTILGPTSLRELMGITAQHDKLHIRQLHQSSHIRF